MIVIQRIFDRIFEEIHSLLCCEAHIGVLHFSAHVNLECLVMALSMPSAVSWGPKNDAERGTKGSKGMQA